MTTLTTDHRRTAIKTPTPLLTGLDAGIYSIAGRYHRRPALLKNLLRMAEDIDAQAALWKEKTDEALKEKLQGFREIFRRHKKDHEQAPPMALAAIREASDRHLGLRPYKVQLAGALALYKGHVAEMATGEGKTLTAGLAGVLWGWMGFPCHIITVNDYLADRDANWLSPLYNFCGVSVGCVTGEMDPTTRRQGYLNDVTYTTCKEIVADFLRDRLWMDTLQHTGRRQIQALAGRVRDIERGLVMRGIHTAVVDEADSIFIDEAVTPLIISRARENEPFVQACRAAYKIAETLEPNKDYRIDKQYKDIELMPSLDDRLTELTRDMPDMFRGPGRRNELIQQALNAKEFFHRDSQYVIQKDKIVIVDEFTGRLMPQRTWRAGLHQMVEAKEKLNITPPSETMARLSFQRFYRFFHKLAGMTGTAHEAASEFWHIYGLPVMTVPLNKPCRRTVYPRQIHADQQSKWKAVVDDIVNMHKQGRPVLIGTRSVKTSEELSKKLGLQGLTCHVLNAVRHKEEAKIVSRAGLQGAITVATNMAGRGTDIKLGEGVAALGGLHVIATECHESARIDRQLFGRSARQGDPGSARSYVSMEDELIVRYVPKPIRETIIKQLQKNTKLSHWTGNKAVKWAQSKAQRIAYYRRRSVLRTDTWLEDSLSFAHGDIAE